MTSDYILDSTDQIQGLKSRRINHKNQESRMLNASNLVQEIVSRAKGVFLWVKLVLNELWEALDESQPPLDLYNTLNALPDDSEGLFTHILRSIRKPNQKESWAIIAAVMAMNNFACKGTPFYYSL
jgi:hypothetical protein